MNRLALAFVAVAGLASQAHANIEIGGVAGVHIFADDNALGTKKNDNLKHANSALFAGRIGVTFGKMLGVEIEAGLIPTESSGTNSNFDIYDAVARVQVIAQFRNTGTNKLVPFALAGGGAIKIVDVSTNDESLITKETDGEIHIGAGLKYHTAGGWGVRGDARVLFVPSNAGKSVTFDFELLASLYREFGGPVAKKAEAPKADEDPDKDGILGKADECPTEPEDKDGFEDENGCPDKDNDADGIPDETDKCASEPEDKDSFQDEDGCPDPDNDNDGVPDTTDKCNDQPETMNGYQDDDGCPDEIPAKLKQFTGTIQGINFKTASADLAPGSNKVLDKAVAVLQEFTDVKLEISGHTDDVALKNNKKFADNDALSQARAESVKAYFVSKGIADDRLIAKGYGSTKPITDPTGLKGGALNKARAQNRRVEFNLIPAAGAEAAAKPAEGGATEAPKTDATAPAPEDKK